jgi:hypothetical protein
VLDIQPPKASSDGLGLVVIKAFQTCDVLEHLMAAIDEIVVIKVSTEVFGDELNQIGFLFCRQHFVSLLLFKAGTPSSGLPIRATGQIHNKSINIQNNDIGLQWVCIADFETMITWFKRTQLINLKRKLL